MITKEFLENYPLYKKYRTDKGFSLDTNYTLIEKRSVPKPPINLVCSTCDSVQTFNMSNEYYDRFMTGDKDNFIHGQVCDIRYTCSACERDFYVFLVYFGYEDIEDGSYDQKFVLQKVGQIPAWSIKMDRNLEKELGEHATLYKRGLENESQGYGIGAFAYFRRITETVIDDLLDSVSALLEGEEKTKYEEALAKTKETRVTQEKIDLVKDLLPTSLRPDGMNPLGVLHTALSEGLHAETDEECLEYADEIKQTLVYLVNQIERSRSASKTFTESMRKILDKRSTKKDEDVEDKK